MPSHDNGYDKLFAI